MIVCTMMKECGDFNNFESISFVLLNTLLEDTSNELSSWNEKQVRVTPFDLMPSIFSLCSFASFFYGISGT